MKFSDNSIRMAYESIGSTGCPKNEFPPSESRFRPEDHVYSISIVLCALLGAIAAVDARHALNPDGVSYMDLADSWLRGDWRNAIKAHWSPLYTWLLAAFVFLTKPTGDSEAQWVHVLNFLLYLFSLCSFTFFLKTLLHGQLRFRPSDTRPTFILFSYAIFLLVSLRWTTLRMVTPDMLVEGIVFAVAALVLKVTQGKGGVRTWICLGLVLGTGYLAKAVLLPLTVMLLTLLLVIEALSRRRYWHLIAAVSGFCLVAAPWLAGLSIHLGRPSFSEAGHLAYIVNTLGRDKRAYYVDQLPQGSALPAPSHPPRVLVESPKLIEFDGPVQGTYPIWTDPGYWHDASQVHFQMRPMLSMFLSNLQEPFRRFFFPESTLLPLTFVILLVGASPRRVLGSLARCWPILFWCALVFAMYATIWVERRYLSGALAVFVCALFLSALRAQRRRFSGLAVLTLKLASFGLLVLHFSLATFQSMNFAVELGRTAISRRAAPELAAAHDLRQMGLHPGDKIASVGYSFDNYFARLGRFRIVAEVVDADIPLFWSAPDKRAFIIRQLESLGVKALVSRQEGPAAEGWVKLADTPYSALKLSP